MATTQHWRRKETAIWPPHGAVYIWAALGAAVGFTLLLCTAHILFALSIGAFLPAVLRPFRHSVHRSFDREVPAAPHHRAREAGPHGASAGRDEG